MSQDQIALTSLDQVNAFDNATKAVQSDYQAGIVDGRDWGGDLTEGEVIRVLAEAYTGELEIESDRAEG